MQVVVVKNCYVPVPWKAFCGKKSQPSAAMLFLAYMSHLPCKSGLQDSDSVQSLTLLGLWKQKYWLAIQFKAFLCKNIVPGHNSHMIRELQTMG